MSTFAGKSVVVTGGSTGLGLGVVEWLADRGAVVTIVSNDPASLAAALDACRRREGEVAGELADVTVASEVAAAVDAAAERGHGISALVNSAGIQTYGTVETTDEAVWDRTLSVNLKGMYLAAKYAIPHIRSGGGGAVVNVASVQGSAAQMNVAAYSASKGGILALTRAMALDHAGEGIRVNSVSPGSVDTPMLRASAARTGDSRGVEAVLADWGRGHPLGRVGRPADVAGMVAFLIGDDAQFITGVDVRVDGGLLAAIALRSPEA
jgi:NAD(P)-dependent dehydrogenase (short-subunit alcohol dehydrogenase family)